MAHQGAGLSVDRSSWTGRSVLVTGGAGFLGSWLCHGLAQRGARVTALGRSGPRPGALFARLALERCVAFEACDVSDAAALDRLTADRGVDFIFHLAGCALPASAAREPRSAYRSNIEGTWNVLEAARLAGRDPVVVVASTDAVYGATGEEACAEDHPLLGSTPYAVSKICAETLARAHARTFGARTVTARFCNLYGEGDAQSDRIVPGTVLSVLRGEAPVIRGDGRARREYLHVEDAVHACLALAQGIDAGKCAAGDPFNFGSGRLAGVLEVVELILRALRRPDLRPRVLGERADDLAVKALSSQKAGRTLGWAAHVGLEAGLERTCAWDGANVSAGEPPQIRNVAP